MSSPVPVLPFVLAGVAAAIVVLALLWQRRRERERAEAMRHFARTRGFDYREKPEKPALTTHLFKRGSGRRARNRLSRTDAGGEVALFDWRFAEHHGNHSHVENQTVALFRRPGAAVPEFELRPENVLHKVAGIFGFKDIDFDNRPEFSSRFVLRGPDERAIRDHFGPALLAFLEKNPGWCVETQGDAIVVYREGKRPSMDDLPAFVDDATRIADALTAAAR